MKCDITINMNDHVQVKLNFWALEKLKASQYHSVYSRVDYNNDNEVVMQLWQLMAIFGEDFANGDEIPFLGNSFSLSGENKLRFEDSIEQTLRESEDKP